MRKKLVAIRNAIRKTIRIIVVYKFEWSEPIYDDDSFFQSSEWFCHSMSSTGDRKRAYKTLKDAYDAERMAKAIVEEVEDEETESDVAIAARLNKELKRKLDAKDDELTEMRKKLWQSEQKQRATDYLSLK